MTFLKSYIHFENTENNIIFDQHLEQITGRTETMGIEELVLTTECKRARIEGEKHRNHEIILSMIQKNFADEIIADIVGVSLEYVQELRNNFVLR